DELFPYIYMRQWPVAVPDEDRRCGFVLYETGGAPAAFITDLATARQQGREAAQALASKFIEGAAPYSDAFVAGFANLAGRVRDFPATARDLRSCCGDPENWPSRVGAALDAMLARYQVPPSYFSSAAYQAVIARIWQSYFALIAILGYDQSLATD